MHRNRYEILIISASMPYSVFILPLSTHWPPYDNEHRPYNTLFSLSGNWTVWISSLVSCLIRYLPYQKLFASCKSRLLHVKRIRGGILDVETRCYKGIAMSVIVGVTFFVKYSRMMEKGLNKNKWHEKLKWGFNIGLCFSCALSIGASSDWINLYLQM